MRLIVDPKDNIRVRHEAFSQLAPELSKLLRTGRRGVGRIANNLQNVTSDPSATGIKSVK